MCPEEKYIAYIKSVRRYSRRTVAIYSNVISEFFEFADGLAAEDALEKQTLRAYEVFLLGERRLSARTVNLHLSVLSGFCRFLMKEGLLQTNPLRTLPRPKQEKRLPVFYRRESMQEYFDSHTGTLEYGNYDARLRYMIMSLLASTGIRRGELITLNEADYDKSRNELRVHGKGGKTREVPVGNILSAELEKYLNDAPEPAESPAPLLRTSKGARLYPVLVDRAVKRELDGIGNVTQRRSPHVLRHTIATELLDNGADLNSIKELLGHSSLAATQVYTHNTVEKLKKAYALAHPRAKKKD